MALTKTGKNFVYSFQHQGKTYRGSTGTDDREQARKFEENKKREIKGLPVGATGEPSITVETALGNHLTRIEGTKEHPAHERYVRKLLGSKKDPVAKRTLAIFGFDKDRLLSSFTNADVQSLINHRKKEGNSGHTIKYEMMVLSMSIDHARRLGYDFPKIDFKELKKVNSLKGAKAPIKYLTEDQLAKLFAELNNTDFEFGEIKRGQRSESRDFFICCALLGNRYSELATLKFDDLDPDENWIRLYRPKVQNESTMAMCNGVIEIFRRRIENRRPDQVYVFEAEDGGPRKYAPRVLKSAAKRAGLGNVTPHQLRHTFATILVRRGISITDIQALLGHVNASTTQIYAKLRPIDSSRRVLNVLDDVMEKKVVSQVTLDRIAVQEIEESTALLDILNGTEKKEAA